MQPDLPAFRTNRNIFMIYRQKQERLPMGAFPVGWCRERDLNPHELCSLPPQDSVSTSSTTSACSVSGLLARLAATCLFRLGGRGRIKAGNITHAGNRRLAAVSRLGDDCLGRLTAFMLFLDDLLQCRHTLPVVADCTPGFPCQRQTGDHEDSGENS